MTTSDYKVIAETLNAQLKGVQDIKNLGSGLRLAVYAICDELQSKDNGFDRLQFEFDCFKHTQFSDGGKKLQERETYMMS
jgi:hypothetical protein